LRPSSLPKRYFVPHGQAAPLELIDALVRRYSELDA
jgi:hypothetical protein